MKFAKKVKGNKAGAGQDGPITLSILTTSSFKVQRHLHSPKGQLHSLAGSFGYVAPEVLNTGTGKQWMFGQWGKLIAIPRSSILHLIAHTCSIIADVLLYGYALFRGDDSQEMIRERRSQYRVSQAIRDQGLKIDPAGPSHGKDLLLNIISSNWKVPVWGVTSYFTNTVHVPM
ncbi:hypothetical protein AZE42_04188 [Rhizopogon vesiculosus]|uniref:Uncharacterized protein n=1 Tax=Rhizopogon vesiculosus TaxID=180088 RepID=A0A1J8Q4B4_9AGAM|nr:hypothetical protein AZE42_04188 [Rhizopogon vesiculosus]